MECAQAATKFIANGAKMPRRGSLGFLGITRLWQVGAGFAVGQKVADKLCPLGVGEVAVQPLAQVGGVTGKVCVPQAHGLVITARGQGFAVRAEGH